MRVFASLLAASAALLPAVSAGRFSDLVYERSVRHETAVEIQEARKLESRASKGRYLTNATMRT